VSADGSVVVGVGSQSAGPTGKKAFRWTQADGMVALGDLGGGNASSIGNAVSADGSVVVGDSAHPNSEAFRWTQATGMVGLGAVPIGLASSSLATAVSADGTVVVGGTIVTSAGEALIWDPSHGMRKLKDVLVQEYGLDLAGWALNFAHGVSADGRTIVGDGINPSGQQEAWIAVLGLPDADGDHIDDAIDNCPHVANADQADHGGVGSGSAPDGIGDACQCGDVTGDGRVTLADAATVQRALLQPPTATLAQPTLCDVNGDGSCTLADAVVLRRALLAPPTATIQQLCAPATP
jgi:probable HAF family extracellular repeat protein